MALRRSDEKGEASGTLSRAQTLDLCARLASYSEADAAPKDLLARAGEEAVARFAEDAEVLAAVGRMYLSGEELGEAERVLRRAVRFAPQDPHALRLLGEVLLRRGEPAAAHAALSSAVACGMNDPWTKTWVARALDYSELLDDLGRDGIARDVRQVLGKPGQGPPDDERRQADLRRSDPPARRYSRKGVLGRMDKGVFFAGDARAEPPDLRAAPSSNDIVDLPTPAPIEVERSGPDVALEAALSQDAAWGTSASAPRSEPMPPSDTEISAWIPDMEAIARERRSAPPVAVRGSSPPARADAATERKISPPQAGMPRLTAADLYDEFTDHKRPRHAIKAAVDAAIAEKARRSGPPPLPEGRSSSTPVAPERSRATPPPLPPFEGDDRPTVPGDPSLLATGRSAALPDDWVPRPRAEEAPAIRVIRDDEPGPVTAPPSALIPLEMPASQEIAPSERASVREPPPMTAPPSALLPPEPPSLQVPTKMLLGGGLRPPDKEASARAASAGGRSPDAAETDKDPSAPAVAAPKKKPRSRLQTIGLRAIAALLLVGVLAGGFELYKRNRSTRVRTFAAQAAIAMHAGGPRGVADAEAALASAKKIDAKNRSVAAAIVRARFFAVVDVDAARLPDLNAAMKDAEAVGVRSADLAFATIASHFVSGDVGGAIDLLSSYDEDPALAGEAIYQLAAGVALEAHDPTSAIDRYRAALKADPELLSAEIRLTRALAFSERGVEANDRLTAMLQKWPGRTELNVLAAIVAVADPTRASRPSIDPATDIDMLPRPLRAAARAIAKPADEQALAKAAAEADIAPIIVFCGEAALRAGNDAAAREAAQHAIEISPSFAPAYALVARVALAAGRFEEARQAALRASPDVASEVLSFIAYEAGDPAAMSAAAGRRAEGLMTEPLSAGLARLRGAAPIPGPTLTLLAKSGRFWADVIAMDGALDVGDLVLAQSIAASWPGAEKHPVRASRVARLYRYQGKNGAAQTAAASAAPTLAARIESALAAAEMASARDAAVASLNGGRTPEERWTLAFLLAREGRAEAAHAAINGLPLPEAEAPLLQRVAAGLALAELHTKNPTLPMYASFAAWQKNPDVARALGLAQPVDPTAPPDGDRPPPEKPVLKGKIPRHDEDPY